MGYFPCPAIESAIFPRTLVSFIGRQNCEIKVWVLCVLIATWAALFPGLRANRADSMCMYIHTPYNWSYAICVQVKLDMSPDRCPRPSPRATWHSLAFPSCSSVTSLFKSEKPSSHHPSPIYLWVQLQYACKAFSEFFIAITRRKKLPAKNQCYSYRSQSKHCFPELFRSTPLIFTLSSKVMAYICNAIRSICYSLHTTLVGGGGFFLTLHTLKFTLCNL